MFSTVSFWTLFWAEVLTTFWASLGGPIDYTLPYPTRFSYVGEHTLLWMALIFIAHLILKQINKSPFLIAYKSLRTALPCYALTGLFGDLVTSLLLYRIQSASEKGVTVWVDPTNPDHVLRSFLIERLSAWIVVFPVAFFVAYRVRGKHKTLNQGQS
jgi:hypothetical protein